MSARGEAASALEAQLRGPTMIVDTVPQARESQVATQQIRVLLVDDHELVRRGLQSILDRNPEIAVVGEASSMQSGISEALRLRPDVVVMDLRLPDARVLILTSHADEDALFAAVLAGASGYVLKDLDPAGIQNGILTVGRGGSLLDPQMATRVLERMRRGSAQHPADDAFAALSPQEDRILEMIGDGMTNRQIADRLSLSEKTVKNYVSELYAKLNVERRAQAASLATERRLRKRQ